MDDGRDGARHGIRRPSGADGRCREGRGARPPVWLGAYVILLVTDYALPAMSLLIVLASSDCGEPDLIIGCYFSSGPSCRGWRSVDAAEGQLVRLPLLPPHPRGNRTSRLGTKMRWLVAASVISVVFHQCIGRETQHTWLTRPSRCTIACVASTCSVPWIRPIVVE